MAVEKLEKLTIQVETEENKFNGKIEVLFNPNQISIQKATKWELTPTAERDAPTSQFTYGEPATLTMDLFFDTYEARSDVRDHTDKIYHLTTVEKHGDLHRPPLCRLAWGKFNFNDFQWVLQSLNQRFTLFLDSGAPVRATLSCTFKQWRSDEVEARLLDKKSPDVIKTRTVRRDDTLSNIAAAAYKDPAQWRPIAEANSIDNPRRLKVGQVLAIPALTGRRTRRKQ
jgi:nucleoid-associated protein YgaU